VRSRAGLGAVEGLDLALLVHRKHQRLVRRVQVKPDHVVNLLGEFWIVRNLEGGNQVRLQAMIGPDPLHAGVTDAHRLGHGADAPMGGVRRCLPYGLRQHQRFHGGSQGRLAGPPVPIPQQTVDPFFNIAFLPAPDPRLALAHSAHDRHRSNPIPPKKHDPRTPDMLLRRIPAQNQTLQSLPIPRRDPSAKGRSHAWSFACKITRGNLLKGAEH
jgi:hypothetical protein